MRNASPRKGSAISNTPDPRPCIGFAISAFPPSAAIVKAARQIDRAPSGNVSNSFSAALIHETGRVFRVIGLSATSFALCRNVVIYDNKCQESHRGSPSFAPAAAELRSAWTGEGARLHTGKGRRGKPRLYRKIVLGLVLRTENRDLATALPALFQLDRKSVV